MALQARSITPFRKGDLINLITVLHERALFIADPVDLRPIAGTKMRQDSAPRGRPMP